MPWRCNAGAVEHPGGMMRIGAIARVGSAGAGKAAAGPAARVCKKEPPGADHAGWCCR